MKALLAILLLASSSAFASYCQPQHDETSPSVTLGTVGAETLVKAYNKLPVSGGVIKVPSGEYGCTTKLWAASRTGVYKNVTIEGVGDTKPVFACEIGTFIAFGPPMYEADGVTPAETKQVALQVRNVELKGWGKWVIGNNIHKIAFHNVKADGRFNGKVRTGNGFGLINRISPIQTGHAEICDSDIGGAGSGNLNHPTYTHGGPTIDEGTFAFVRSTCRESNGSHCVKTTAASKVLVEDSLFLNECLEGQLCGTQVLNFVAATKLAVIRRNKFVRGNLENPTQIVPAGSIVSTSNRKYFAPELNLPAGHDSAPLYDVGYGTPTYNDPAFWESARQAGESHANPYLRISVWTDNTFINYAQAKPAMLIHGTYPVTSDTYLSDCLTPLPVPQGWMELSRLAIGNNTFIGNYPEEGPINTALPNTCKLPMPAEATPVPVWDLGGNGPCGTQRVDLPEWVKKL